MPAAKLPIRQLRAFLAAATHGGVTRAAAEMQVTQPAVSQAIAALERLFGAALLHRAEGPFLTEHGEVLRRRCAAFFQRLDAAVGPEAAREIGAVHLRGLIGVVDHGSLTQAARALGLSAPSLQRAARDLERLLGRPLYARTAAGLAANDEARALADVLREAAQEIEAAKRDIDQALGRAAARISIGTLPMSSAVLIAGACRDLLAEWPEAQIKIHEGRFFNLLKDLRAGEIDLIFGVLRQPDGDDVSQFPVLERHYHLVARRDHPLVLRGGATLEDLQRYDWVLPVAGNPRRKVCEDLLAGIGARPRIRIETNSISTQREILVGTDHITLLTSRELEASGGALGVIAWNDLPMRPPEGVTLRANWTPSPAQARFLALIEKRAQEMAAAALN